jgi:acyl-CoA thioester hydrolase
MEKHLRAKVYYEDTDSLGVVYYANYLRFFERGRSEYIESLGKPISWWNEEGYNVAVFKMNITFHKPARLGDVCDVVTEIVPGSSFRLKMKQKLMRGDELLTDADVLLVCVDENFEVREFPEDLLPLMT